MTASEEVLQISEAEKKERRSFHLASGSLLLAAGESKEEIEIPFSKLKRGDLVVVMAGQTIPGCRSWPMSCARSTSIEKRRQWLKQVYSLK